MKKFFTDSARTLHFPVYCPVLPSTWWGEFAMYDDKVGGHGVALVQYTNASDHLLLMEEGYLCGPVDDCSQPPFELMGTAKGKVWMADLGAYFFVLEPITAKVGGQANIPVPLKYYAAWAPFGKHVAYLVVGAGMGEYAFRKLMHTIIKVHRT